VLNRSVKGNPNPHLLRKRHKLLYTNPKEIVSMWTYQIAPEEKNARKN